MSKALIVKIARLYKPLDNKLRKNEVYFKTSEFLRMQIYQRFFKTYIILPHVENYYIQYHTTKVNDSVALFDSFWGRSIGCNPYAVFLEMYSRPELSDVTFYWTKDLEVEAPLWMQENKRIIFVQYHSSEYIIALLTAKYLLANSNLPHYFVRKPEQFFINTWHGIPLKAMGKDVPKVGSTLASLVNTQRNFSESTHILMASEYATEKTVLSFGDTGSQKRVLYTGSPRVDITLKADRNTVQRALNIPLGKKLILFAPTWRGDSQGVLSGFDEQLEVVKRLEQSFSQDYHILVSIHNYTKSKLTNLPENCSVVPTDININEILAGVDVLISDYSSIFFDFLVLDRPTILHVSDLEQYKAQRGLYLDIHEIPATITQTFDELEGAIRQLSLPSSKPTYKEFMEMVMPMEDGMASARAVDAFTQSTNEIASTVDASKKSVVIYAGGIRQNGITHALLNLLNSFDEHRFELFVIVESHSIDNFPMRRELFDKIPNYCKVILRANSISIEKKDYEQIKSWGMGNQVIDMRAINAAFSYESRRILGDRSFDYAIDYSGYSPFWAKLISLTVAKKKIIFQHSDLLSETKNPLKSLKSLLNVVDTYKDFDRVVAVSPALRDVNYGNFSDSYGGEDKAVFARNVILPEQIHKKSNQHIPILDRLAEVKNLNVKSSDEIVKFVTVGRLSSEKNQLLLIQSMKKVLDAGHRAFLIVVGDGDKMDELVKSAKKLGVTDYVFFTGELENPFPVIKLADCFVLSSNYEGQPVVLLEALTLGKYCIGSNIASIEYVLNGNGTIAKRTPEDFANAMVDFAKNQSERKNSVKFDANVYHETVMNEFYSMLES